MYNLKILTLWAFSIACLIFILDKKDSTEISPQINEIDKTWFSNNKKPLTPKEEVRINDQTFLTFPEWFTVYSPQEQAEYFKTKTSSSFPYLTHIRQLWQAYEIIRNNLTNNYEEFNLGYHFMVGVVSVSTTAEYGCKAFYETIFGRFTNNENLPMTEEDLFIANFNQKYVAFLNIDEWYNYNFKTEIVNLWTKTSFFGPRFFRKLERKYFLTSELIVKELYGLVIRIGASIIYGASGDTTLLVVKDFDKAGYNLDKNIKFMKEYSDKSDLLLVPRYEPFTRHIITLAKAGFNFQEIAGNNGAILVSVLTSKEWTSNSENFKEAFTQKIITKENQKRTALVTSVELLGKTLRELKDDKIEVEHVYDY